MRALHDILMIDERSRRDRCFTSASPYQLAQASILMRKKCSGRTYHITTLPYDISIEGIYDMTRCRKGVYPGVCNIVEFAKIVVVLTEERLLNG